MDTSPEKYCQALGCVFQTMMNEMKSSVVLWEDFAIKCAKLQNTLKVSLQALGAFLDSFQKIADLSMNSKGGARELGASLTRLCMRQRTVEAKLKTLTTALVEQLANPVLEKIEDWKRNAATIDKDRTRDYKKARQEVKRASMDTLRMQKKVRKTSGAGMPAGANGNGGTGVGAISGTARSFSNAPTGTLTRDSGVVAQAQLDLAMQDVNARWNALQDAEQCSVRKAMREERARFCFFISCFRPILEVEVSLLSEMSCFQEIAEKLAQQATDSSSLPSECEQLLTDLRNSPELLLKSFSQSQSQLQMQSNLPLSQSQSSAFTNADSISLGSGCASEASSISGDSHSHSLTHSSDAPLASGEPGGELSRPRAQTHAPQAPLRRESIASLNTETLMRRASKKNMAQYATTSLHHCATDSSSNLLHASVVSMSTNSLVSNASRSSCSSAGASQPNAHGHTALIGVPKSALAGMPSSSAASALLCVAAAARSAATAKATSQDSGFISQDTLYASCPVTRNAPTGAGAANAAGKRSGSQSATDDGIIWMQKDESPESTLDNFENYIGQMARQLGDMTDDLPPSRSDSPSHGSSASPVSTWTNWPEQPGYFDPKVLNAQLQARPYTVSAPGAGSSRKSYHNRLPLNEKMFEPPVALAGDLAGANSNDRPDVSKLSAKMPPPVPNKCSSLHEPSHYAHTTIQEDSFETSIQKSQIEDDVECTLTKAVGACDEEFPAPPSADILQRIAADVQQVHIHSRGDTVDALPLPPPPSDYADPMRPSPSPYCDSGSNGYTPPVGQPYAAPGVVRSLASECSPISKLIQELSAKTTVRTDDPSSAQAQHGNARRPSFATEQIYAAVGQVTRTNAAEQVYAAPNNTVNRQSRPTDQSEYAQTGVRHSSRTRPAPPQRRSSVQLGAGIAPQPALSLAQIRQLAVSGIQYQSPSPSPQASEYQPNYPIAAVPTRNSGAPARQSFTSDVNQQQQQRERAGFMQVVGLPVDIQPTSGSLTSHAPLAVPIPAVRMSIGGIAACPPELTEHTGAILRQIKSGVNLRHCSASLINDKSRPLLRF